MSRNFVIGDKSCCGCETPTLLPIKGYCNQLLGVLVDFKCGQPPVYIHKPPMPPALPPVPFYPPGIAPVPVPAPVPGPMPTYPSQWIQPPAPVSGPLPPFPSAYPPFGPRQ